MGLFNLRVLVIFTCSLKNERDLIESLDQEWALLGSWSSACEISISESVLTLMRIWGTLYTNSQTISSSLLHSNKRCAADSESRTRI